MNVDSATPKRWIRIRGHDFHHYMGVASHLLVYKQLLASIQYLQVATRIFNGLHPKAIDATFRKDSEKTFKVGDSVSGEISFIDLKKDDVGLGK